MEISSNNRDYQCFLHVINTHTKLSDNQKQRLAYFLQQSYSSGKYNLSLIITILTLLNLDGIGKLAYTFNYLVEKALQSDDDLSSVIDKGVNPQLSFPEIFDNDYLTVEQTDILKDSFVFYLSQTSQILYRCRVDKTIEIVKAACQCGNPCGDIIDYEKFPNTILVSDLDQGQAKTFQLPLADLVLRIAQGNYLNPQTGQPFSVKTLSILQRRLAKELAMAKRFIRNFSSTKVY